MKENVKLLYLWEEKNEDGCVTYQNVENPDEDIDNIKVYFGVNNLNERPEDAIIGRDLFDANDYLQTLKTGMKLAKAGYDDIRFADVRG